MRNTRLALRGLILVGFPLLCQIAFVAFLAPLFWNVQSSVLRSNACRQLVVDMHDYVVAMVELLPEVGLGMNSFTWPSKRAKMLQMVPTMEKNIDRLMIRIATMLGDNNLEVAKVMAEQQSIGQTLDPLIQSIAYPFKTDADKLKYLGFLRTAIDHFLQSWEVVTEQVGSRQLKETQYYTAQMGTVFSVLTISVIVSMAIALFLWRLYTITITDPVRRLIENSRRMASNEELLPEENAQDELGRFDHQLHVVSNAFNTTLQRERAIVDRAAAMIFITNENGVITEVNNYSTRLLGIPSEQIVGRSVEDIVPADQVLAANVQITEARRSKEPRVFELQVAAADGSLHDTRWSCFRSKENNDLFCVVQDIGAEKNIQRMKQEFVDMVSHDLRVPLEAVLEMLRQVQATDASALSKAAQDEVVSATQSASILVALINDLLDFQTMQTHLDLDLQKEQLEQIIAEAATLVRNSADAQKVTLTLPSGHYAVTCDRSKVLQTISNLLANAIKYSPEHGTITVDVVEGNDKVNVYVIDEGPGVPAEFRDKIFSPFEQLPNSREGVGLGLAICKLNIEAHGGTIGVKSGGLPYSDKSRTGAEIGSSFWFTLPKNGTPAPPKRTL